MWLIRRPKAPLSDFVDMLWLYEGAPPAHARERLLPSAEMELVVNLQEDRIRLYENDSVAFRTGQVMIGARSKYCVIDTAEQQSVAGVHFRSGGAFPFMALPCGELRDEHVDLEQVWGGFVGDLRDRLLETGDAEKRFDILENALILRLRDYGARDGSVYFAMRELRRGCTVADVAAQTGWSQRRFIEKFKAEVGLTPKLYCRLERFQKLLRSIEHRKSVDWADAALKCGYFDQSHFNHEFKEFSGITPSDYLASEIRNRNHVPIPDSPNQSQILTIASAGL